MSTPTEALQRFRDDVEAAVIRIGQECAALHERIDRLERRMDELDGGTR